MGSNWKATMFVVVLGVGLCFEVFKQLPIGQSLLKRDNGQAIGSDAYALRASRLQGGKLATPSYQTNKPMVISGVANSTLVNTSEKNMSEESAAAKAAAAVEKKKKKKKKKKKEEAETVLEETIVKKVKSDDEDAPYRSPHAGADSAIVKQAAAAAAAAPQEDEPLTLEQWIELLSNNPTQENIDKLKAAYDERSISAETYYKVGDALLQDKRVNVQIAGVNVIGMNRSVASFLILSEISNETAGDSPVRQRAELFINRYADIGGLNVLQSVLASSDNQYATIKATQKVDSAIAKYAKKKTTPAPTTTSLVAHNNSAGTSYARYFTPFVGILKNLSTSADGGVAQQASETLKNLQAFLDIKDTAAAPAQAGL